MAPKSKRKGTPGDTQNPPAGEHHEYQRIPHQPCSMLLGNCETGGARQPEPFQCRRGRRGGGFQSGPPPPQRQDVQAGPPTHATPSVRLLLLQKYTQLSIHLEFEGGEGGAQAGMGEGAYLMTERLEFRPASAPRPLLDTTVCAELGCQWDVSLRV